MRESLTPSKPRERSLAKTETNARPAAVTMPMTVPVLLPLALPAPYDYLVPEGVEVEPGQFVVAPLGTVEYLAVVWPRPEGIPKPQIERAKLREIVEVLDDVPKLPRVSLEFADWVASYTLSSPGMVPAHDDERRPRLRSSGAALWRAPHRAPRRRA
jgi:hypothetical protein